MPIQSPGLPAGLTVGQLYPKLLEQIVESHRKLQDHRLQLAVWFDTDHRKDFHLFEVLGDFPPYDEPSKFYTSRFESNFGFLIPTGGSLELIMTSTEELREALTKRYPQLTRLRKAFGRNAARVIYCAPSMKRLLEDLKSAR
jgi:hypothetical protein